MAIRGVRAAAAAGCLAAFFAFAAPAIGEELWRDFSFDDKGFQIHFPSDPERSEVVYKAAGPAGTSVAVPATRFSLRRGQTTYSIEVAELGGTQAEDPKALENAVSARLRAGEPGLDTWVSISNGNCGRYLGFTRPDGAINYVALFYNAQRGRLYDIEAVVPPADQAERGADAVHFQQSLSFLPDPDAEPAPKPQWPDAWVERNYANPGFIIRFPGDPDIRADTYVTRDGVSVPATRYELREGTITYRVIAVHAWETDADTPDVIDQAVDVWERKAASFEQEVVGLANGQCGRDLSALFPSEGGARARIFFPSSQHRLYIVEVRGLSASAEDFARAALFQASFAIAKPGEE